MHPMDPLLALLEADLGPDLVARLTADPQCAHYLAHVRALTLAALPAESAQLAAQAQQVDRALTALAVDSRPQLIATSTTLESFTARFDTLVNDALPPLTTVLPALANNVASFEPRNERTPSATLLANVDKILDILELPTLLLTCVRNGNYAEALDLVGHVRRLGIRFRGLKVIDIVQAEVDTVLLEMTTTLLRLLRENVQLPTAIKVISYLRRLQPFQASPNAALELQHIYLLSRMIHLKTQLRALDPLRGLPEKYLKRYIELFREFVFAAVVGFRSIFPKEHADIDDTSTVDPGEQLLSSFIYNAIATLRATFAAVIPTIPDKSTYESLYLQIIYSSQSLARVGGEFWSLLADNTDLASYTEQHTPNPWISALAKQRELAKKLKTY
ncbi:oligomeric Golgi complex subunit 8 [Limtongia smithiae]|uniref:oligomeric Golgi complex subunit 8 n=1 Tax=Limtongia smithiae TaxID=1125753 RepID=UPI0034CD9DE2